MYKNHQGAAPATKWLQVLKEGQFSFGKADISYVAKGKDSWKYLALGTEKHVDSDSEVYPYNPSFLNSDWKLFHDALQYHHFYMLHELLPRYGICVA